MDGFREFVGSTGFDEVFDLNPQFKRELMQDEVKLLRFGFRLLKQVLFGEKSIELKPDAAHKRIARYRDRKVEADKAVQLAEAQDRLYESLGD